MPRKLGKTSLGYLERSPKRISEGEETLALHLRAEGYTFRRQYQFCPTRRWSFDFMLREPSLGVSGIAIEVEGGLWTKGRHIRPQGYEADMIKYNEAAMANWLVFRFSTEQVKKGIAIDYVRRLI